jgi:hypothetical protein
MFEAVSIDTQHKDLIHDVAFDFYGQRMATCSSDQLVKVCIFLQTKIIVNSITKIDVWFSIKLKLGIKVNL